MAKHTLKILGCSHCKNFTVYLAIFQHFAGKSLKLYGALDIVPAFPLKAKSYFKKKIALFCNTQFSLIFNAVRMLK